MEARLARRLREVDDTDGVARIDLVLVERGLGAREQLRIDARRAPSARPAAPELRRQERRKRIAGGAAA